MAWVQRIRNGLDEQRFCLFAQEIRSLNKAEQDRSHVELLLRLRDEDGNWSSLAALCRRRSATA